MQRTLSVFAVVTGLASFGAVDLHAQQPQKFGYINSQKVLQEAPGRAEASAEFEKKLEPFRKRDQAIRDSVKVLSEALKKEEATLTAAQKTQRQSALETKVLAWQEESQKMQERAQALQDSMFAPFTDAVQKILNDIRAQEGYAFIFDVADATFIVAADKNLDLSDAVIARLRTMARTSPAPASTGAAKPPPPGSTTGPVTKPAGVTTTPPPATRPPPPPAR